MPAAPTVVPPPETMTPEAKLLPGRLEVELVRPLAMPPAMPSRSPRRRAASNRHNMNNTTIRWEPRTNPGNYDPLGADASEGDLAALDEERLRFAASNYISAAYGYTGDDADAYNQGVGATVVWPDFFDSEGSSETKRYAEQVGESGTKSGAALTEFETLEITEDRATAYAYFETGSGYASDGSLTGEDRKPTARR